MAGPGAGPLGIGVAVVLSVGRRRTVVGPVSGLVQAVQVLWEDRFVPRETPRQSQPSRRPAQFYVAQKLQRRAELSAGPARCESATIKLPSP